MSNSKPLARLGTFDRRANVLRGIAPEPPSRGGQDERDQHGNDQPHDVRVDADGLSLLQRQQVDPVAEEPDGQGSVGIEESVCAEARHGDRLLAELRTHVGEIDRQGDEYARGGDDVEDGPDGRGVVEGVEDEVGGVQRRVRQHQSAG